ncbi:protein TAG 333, f [Trichuris trichiura]|uniref:Protein TAG 333, f n=1 Tax=Trichuris trichiura TaxID=36087 RepID=A0A077YWU1_TRITR|nr:protein TAG 333, f [Trichuris trichiura]
MATATESVLRSANSSLASLESPESTDEDEVFITVEDSSPEEISRGDLSKSCASRSPSPERKTSGLTIMERLVRSHPIWYLPHVGRLAATHLLRGKEDGNFIVRQSTQTNSMALTVRLPAVHEQNAIEHYLVELTPTGVRLEGSPNSFAALPLLLAYYMENGEELECQLRLPKLIMQCEMRRELCSYALLGQEFWTARLPPPRSVCSPPPRSQTGVIDLATATKSVTSNGQRDGATANGFVAHPRSVSLSGGCSKIPSSLSSLVRSPNRLQVPTSSKMRSESLSDAVGHPMAQVSAELSQRRQFRIRNIFENSKRPEPPIIKGPSPYFCHNVGREQSSSMIRKRLLTFKPNKADSTTSLADIASTSNQEEPRCGNNGLLNGMKLRSFGSALRPSFNLLRREKSDLGWCSYGDAWRTAMRTSAPQDKSKKAAPAVRSFPSGIPNVKTNSFPRPFATSAASSATGARFRNCVEELRRCRLNGSHRTKMFAASPKETGNFRNVPERKMNATAAGATTPPTASVLRQKSTRMEKSPGKRLSAPGSIDLPIGADASNTVGLNEVLRELKSKQQQQQVQQRTLDMEREEKVPLDTIKEVQHFARQRRRSRSLETLSIKESVQALPMKIVGSLGARIRSKAAKEKRLPRMQKDTSIFHVAKSSNVEETKNSEYGVVRESVCMPTVGGSVTAPLAQEEVDDNRSIASLAGTVFSEPWDSSMWENLLTIASSMDQPEPANQQQKINGSNCVRSNGLQRRMQPTSFAKVSTMSVDGISMGPSLAERIKALQDNNFPAVFAPPWDEFSRRIPLPSDGSLPASSSPNGSLSSRSSNSKESKRLELIARERFVDQLNSFSVSDCDSDSLFAKARCEKRKTHRLDSGIRIQKCVVRLAEDEGTFIGAQVHSFIRCTTEAHETDPHVVLGNVRQFINGLKNYLVKQGEATLHSLIEVERSNLKPNEFLNIDAILEGVLQKVVLAPLKPHIYHTLVKESSKNGSLEVFSENMAALRSKLPAELGLLDDKCDSVKMDRVRSKLRSMQHHYSPLKKLEYLLGAVSAVYHEGDATCGKVEATLQLPAADELVRMLVYLLARCSVVGCEIEADYIWGLLHPALLFGEASYYLTALSSAVHVLKHIDLLPKLNESCPFAVEVILQNSFSRLATLCPFFKSIETAGAFLRIAIPDEVSGAIHYHCFPALPQISAAKLCKFIYFFEKIQQPPYAPVTGRMIAHKFGITNPEDHGIYLLVDGFETCLLPSECPELVKEQLRAAGKPHMFAYKRHEAKIAWPKVALSPPPPN